MNPWYNAQRVLRYVRWSLGGLSGQAALTSLRILKAEKRHWLARSGCVKAWLGLLGDKKCDCT